MIIPIKQLITSKTADLGRGAKRASNRSKTAASMLFLFGLLALPGGTVHAESGPPTSGLQLHLDAGHIQGLADGMPLSSGWADKIDPNQIFSSTNPPTFLSGEDEGYPALRFDGEGQFLEGTFGLGAEATVFIVYANRRAPLKSAYQDTLLASADPSGVHLTSSRLVENGYLIQFGWDRDSYYRPAYRDQIGADEIVQWNGLDSFGGNFNDNGTLNNQPVGATLTSVNGDVTLTSEVIASSDPEVSHTRQSGSQLGLSIPGENSSFREELESSWTFSFDKEVELTQLIMSGYNNVNDTALVNISGGGSYEVTTANTTPTDGWEDRSNLHARVFTFPSPVTLAPGTQVTITAQGADNPNQNIFFVGGIIVALPTAPPDYPGFVSGSDPASSPLETWVNGLDTTHAGTDILPHRFYVGTATYTSLPGSASYFLGSRNQNAGFGQNDIREVLVYDSVLSGPERIAVQRYLGEKHGIPMANYPPDHPLSQYNHILGAQQIGRQYSFGESGRQVLDAARAMYRQGANVFKLSISSNYARQSGVPINPEISNLTELVRDEPSIRAVFDMPFKDVLFWCSSFAVPNFMARRTADGLPEADQQLIYDEIYDFTVYLLETYSGTGRRFYVGNWEGDWVLATLGSQDPETTVTPERIQTMVDWATIRQQAIDDAKIATPHSDVEVWHYLEMNRGDWTIEDRPSVVNSVMPLLDKLDMVSFSAYTVRNLGRAETAAVLDKIRDALPPLDDTLPDYLNPTGERLIIGEYGYFQGPNNQYEQTYNYIEEIQNFLSWGPRFILMWEFFWEEDADSGLPKNMHMISSNNELHPLYHLHEQYYRHLQAWVEDHFESTGTFPTDEAYRDEAMQQVAAFSPWPFVLKMDPLNSRTLQIPDTVNGTLTETYSAQVTNGFGDEVFHEPIVWQLQPASQGASVGTTSGTLSIAGNATPGPYTLTASLASDSEANTSSALNFTLPVASIYDTFRDFSKVSTINPALQIVSDNAAVRFEGDDARVRRINTTQSQPITWNVSGLNRFHAKVFYFNNLGLSAEISADGSNWQPLTLRVDPGTTTTGSWRRAWVAPSEPLPAGTNYLRLNLQDSQHDYTPQIGEVIIFGEATGYAFWKQQNFPDPSDQMDPNISGPGAEFGGSGVSNLARYLTEMGLSETDYSVVPEIRRQGNQLVYAVPFDPTKSDVRVRVMASLDLQTWPYTVFDSFTDTATTEDGWLLIDFDAIPEANAKFMRVVWDLD